MTTETELWEALRSAAKLRDEASRAALAASTAYQEAHDRYQKAWQAYYAEIMRPEAIEDRQLHFVHDDQR